MGLEMKGLIGVRCMNSKLCRYWILGWLLASCLVSSVCAAPSVTHYWPLAVKPGETTDVTCYGAELAAVQSIWTSFPVRFEKLPNAEGVDANKQMTLRIVLPHDTPVSVGGLRLVSPTGVSPLRLLFVDDLQSTRDAGNNHQVETPQQVSLPTAVDGNCDSLVSDFYLVTATAGQALSVDVFAQRIGSQLDPIVRLLRRDGVELAHADDSPGVGADCRLRYEFTEDGEYLLEIRDVRHQGGEQHFYRLRLGDFPLVTVAYPMGGRSGSVASFQVKGQTAADLSPMHYLVPEQSNRFLSLGLQHKEGQGSGFVTLLTSDYSDFLETEENNTLEGETKVTLPIVLNGICEQPGDEDYFRFDGVKGQRWMIRAATRDLGSPADLYMEILRADGNRLASVDDVGKDEGFMDFTVPEDGVYALRVEDLHGNGSPSHAYRVEIKPFHDWFSLSVDAETFTVPHGGTISVKVTSQRRGYGGPIELSVEGAGEGIQLAGQTIAKDKNETQLLVTFPSRIVPGSLEMVRIVGRAKIEEQDFMASAETLTALRTAIPVAPYLPAALGGSLAVGFGPEFPAFFGVALADPSAFYPAGKESSQFKVLVNRIQEKFTAAIEVGIHDLPEGFTAKVEPVEEGKAEYLVTLTGPADAAEANHKFRITGKGTYENQTKEVALGEVSLEIVKPLVVRITAQGNIPPGGQQKLLVKVYRFEEEKHPVTVRWKEGPSWLLTPVEVTIPADQDQIEVVLASVGETAAGTEGNLVALATSLVGGQPLNVESPAVVLRVEAPPAE